MPLLYVLWTVALLTIIAAAAQSSGTLSYRLARNVADAAEQEALAEAALNKAVLSLLDARPQERPPVDGTARRFDFDGAEFSVAIQDESGRIDLNHASAALLANLFRAAGAPSQQADRIAVRILDWRDGDDLHRLNGMEKRGYRAAGFPDRPRNGMFPSVEELRLVSGVTPALFAHVEPVLTVHSGKPMIDPRVAPPLARQALRGGPFSTVGPPTKGHSRRARAGAQIDPLSSLNGRAFLIRIGFPWKEAQFSRTAIIRLTGHLAKPYWLLRWRGR